MNDESHLLGIKQSLEHDDSGFVHNFNVLMKSLKNKELYGIKMLNQNYEGMSYEGDPYSYELQLEWGAIPALCVC